MKTAVIDKILLWIVIFVAFYSIFFIIIDYYKIIKVKDRCDALANYGSRMKALGKNDSTIISGLNNIKNGYFDTIYDENMTCTTLVTTNYQVIFTTNITFKNRFLNDGEYIYAKSASFNEIDSFDQNCSLNLSVSN